MKVINNPATHSYVQEHVYISLLTVTRRPINYISGNLHLMLILSTKFCCNSLKIEEVYKLCYTHQPTIRQLLHTPSDFAWGDSKMLWFCLAGRDVCMISLKLWDLPSVCQFCATGTSAVSLQSSSSLLAMPVSYQHSSWVQLQKVNMHTH